MGGIGGPGGDVGDMGSAGYGGGYGTAVTVDGTATGSPAFGSPSGIGGGPGGIAGGPGGFGGGADVFANRSGTYNSPGGVLGTGYPVMSGGGAGGGYIPGGTGTGTGSYMSFYYPTPQEAHNAIYGLPYMANQARILGNMESMPAFREAVLPEVQGVMRALGRTGLPSSSYADRTITDTMGSLYNKWMWNVLTGYQNMGAQMPAMMQQWYNPYNTMLPYVGS